MAQLTPSTIPGFRLRPPFGEGMLMMVEPHSHMGLFLVSTARIHLESSYWRLNQVARGLMQDVCEHRGGEAALFFRRP